MVNCIQKQAGPLPRISTAVADFSIPADSEVLLQKAESLRNWMASHREFLAAFRGADDGLFNLIGYSFAGHSLTLLPPEIGQLRGLRILDLRGINRIIALPAEVSKFQLILSLVHYMGDERALEHYMGEKLSDAYGAPADSDHGIVSDKFIDSVGAVVVSPCRTVGRVCCVVGSAIAAVWDCFWCRR
jgi:hypothetical protein